MVSVNNAIDTIHLLPFFLNISKRIFKFLKSFRRVCVCVCVCMCVWGGDTKPVNIIYTMNCVQLPLVELELVTSASNSSPDSE